MIKRLFVAAATISILQGCSSDSSVPSTDDIKAALKGHGEIVHFEKTNGESKVIDGQDIHIAHYSFVSKLGNGWAFRMANGPHREGVQRWVEPSKGYDMWAPKLERLPVGSLYALSGTVQLRKTEKGWLPDEPKYDAWGLCNADDNPAECSPYRRF